MMKIPLLIVFLTFSNFVISQNISLDQAQSLRTKSLSDVELFLTSNGWSMTNAEEATTDKLGVATFGYNVDQFDGDKATGWITYYESSFDNSLNRLSIQVHKPSLYSKFLSRLTANGYILKDSKIENGGIKKVYKNKTTTCVVTTATSQGVYTKSTTYKFFFIDNESYKINFEN